MCSALRGFVFSHEDDVSSLIRCNLHDIFQLLARRRASSPVLDFLPPESAAVFLRHHVGPELRVTPVCKSRRLPGSSGMLTQLPPSACFHLQMGTSLSWARQHMFTPSSSPTCFWREVAGNARRVVTSLQNFRDKHVDGICSPDLSLRCFGVEECLASLPQFRSLQLTVFTATASKWQQAQLPVRGRRLSDMTAEQSMTWSWGAINVPSL